MIINLEIQKKKHKYVHLIAWEASETFRNCYCNSFFTVSGDSHSLTLTHELFSALEILKIN